MSLWEVAATAGLAWPWLHIAGAVKLCLDARTDSLFRRANTLATNLGRSPGHNHWVWPWLVLRPRRESENIRIRTQMNHMDVNGLDVMVIQPDGIPYEGLEVIQTPALTNSLVRRSIRRESNSARNRSVRQAPSFVSPLEARSERVGPTLIHIPKELKIWILGLDPDSC
ncbi:hypothetical protein LA080_016254 [Diaporthe eres]|nr:hypothetical protein LA080_016254 [Diaporthe eres]